ncbi:MAG: N-acetylneuraminate synthase family protein [Leptospiraceae bacterium]|nr:N-acetylneuraminate synthase family protein [Leptospiraceae bacterium]
MLFKNEFNIGNKTISRHSSPYLVAEIGLNHNNDLEIGKRTIEAAAKSGASAVKFQTYTTSEFIDENNVEAKFLYDIFKQYELSEQFHLEFQKTAKDLGVDFFSTPLCESAVDLLVSLKVPVIKVASGDVVNFQLLKKIAKTNLPVFLSSGAADFYEVVRAIEFFGSNATEELCLMHCVSLYPAPPEKLNLKTIELYGEMYSFPLGFSDHSKGFTGAVLSVGLGARVIEKHFTLDKSLPGPDHTISANPEELKLLSEQINSAYLMIGERKKIVHEEELNGRYYGRRSAYLQENKSISLRPALHTKDSSILESWDISKIENSKFAKKSGPIQFKDIL